MSGLTGVIAGLAVVVGAVALYRFAGRKLDEARDAVVGRKKADAQAPVLDYELDRATGIFRAK